MAGAVERDCTSRETSSGPSGSCLTCRERYVHRYPIGGAIVWSGVEPIRNARDGSRVITLIDQFDKVLLLAGIDDWPFAMRDDSRVITRATITSRQNKQFRRDASGTI